MVQMSKMLWLKLGHLEIESNSLMKVKCAIDEDRIKKLAVIE